MQLPWPMSNSIPLTLPYQSTWTLILRREPEFLRFRWQYRWIPLIIPIASMNARQDLREQINDPVSIHLSDISQRRFDTSQSSGTQQVSLSEKVWLWLSACSHSVLIYALLFKTPQYPPNHSQENAIGVSIQTLTYVDDKEVDRYQTSTSSIDQRGHAF